MSTNSPPQGVSKHGAMFYYSGISPTPPKLVYRTGSAKAPWVKPTGPEAQRRLKQVRGVYGHKLNNVWHEVIPRLRSLLKDHGVAWTSVDVARFVTKGYDGQEIIVPVVLWIGVVPDTLQHEKAFHSANDLLALLTEFGTMALYFAEGGQSDKVLGLTCHHVLFKTDAGHNDEYKLKSAGARHEDVQLLSPSRFEELLVSIKLRIWKISTSGKSRSSSQLEDAHEVIEELEKFYTSVRKDWGNAEQRTIGHIRYSSALTLGATPGGFTSDWAAFELDGSRFKKAFNGNFIDLSTPNWSRE